MGLLNKPPIASVIPKSGNPNHDPLCAILFLFLYFASVFFVPTLGYLWMLRVHVSSLFFRYVRHNLAPSYPQDGLREADGDLDGLADLDGLVLALGLALSDGLRDSLGLRDGLALGDADGLTLDDGLADLDGDAEADGDADSEGEIDGDADGDGDTDVGVVAGL